MYEKERSRMGIEARSELERKRPVSLFRKFMVREKPYGDKVGRPFQNGKVNSPGFSSTKRN